MSNKMQVAETIIKQMGGSRRLQVMVGAHNFMGDESNDTWVQFKFKGCRKANTCRVVLDTGADLYTMELWKITMNRRTFEVKTKKVFELDGMYFDMLKPVFEEETGLYLSL